MIKGIQAAETSMRPKMMRLEVIANNLANVSTTGFKRERLFVQMLKDSSAPQADPTGELDGVKVTEGIDLTQGSLQQTTNPLDVALQGRGFFVVDTPRGVRYTRNGSFHLATDGTLVNSDGFPVAGANGQIHFPDLQHLQQGTVSITETGEILVDKDTIGKLRVVDFADATGLKKDTASLIEAPPEKPVQEGPGPATAVKQGFVEESNVDGVEEMIAMTELQRSFETDQKVLQAMDDSLTKTMEVGKL